MGFLHLLMPFCFLYNTWHHDDDCIFDTCTTIWFPLVSFPPERCNFFQVTFCSFWLFSHHNDHHEHDAHHAMIIIHNRNIRLWNLNWKSHIQYGSSGTGYESLWYVTLSPFYIRWYDDLLTPLSSLLWNFVWTQIVKNLWCFPKMRILFFWWHHQNCIEPKGPRAKK